MNEEQRWKEKKESEARAEARKKELRSRPQPNYKTYEFTLKNVDLPGLPAPMAKTNTIAAAKGKGTGVFKIETPDAPGDIEKLTNGIAKTSAKGDDDEVKDDSDVPTVDITLEEGRRILQDLVALTTGKNGLAGRP